MNAPVSLTRIPAEAPAAADTDWVSPALVALALLAWLGSVTLFVTHPLGELHDVPGVWIGDASAFPTSTGTNPMISTMALAHRTSEALMATAG